MQILNEEKGKIELTNVIDISDDLNEIAEERKVYEWNRKSTYRKIASIPLAVFIAMGDKGFDIYRDDKKLKEFIKQHPEYRIDGGNI